METFRCNHDIQLLLGGTRSTDRIYCCKYVTNSGWIDSYLRWWDFRSYIAREIMCNLDDYYAGKETADKGGESNLAFLSSELNSDSEGEDDGMFGSDSGEENIYAGDNIDDVDLLGQFDFVGGNDTLVLTSSDLDPVVCPTMMRPKDTLEQTIERFGDYNMFHGTIATINEVNSGCVGFQYCEATENVLSGQKVIQSWVSENGLNVDDWVNGFLVQTRTQLCIVISMSVMEAILKSWSCYLRHWLPIIAIDKEEKSLREQYRIFRRTHRFKIYHKRIP
ncbi:hypothetical protein PHMEG_00020942 [Phytophthora megakarya]|uniref:Uncharacterized protein n=1 Tax=Phytophthora megakarya TaxID=4795 RepID=A0A225VMX1_9STRA|nr:hypothetical protein PHMEG_00020942 [Phytophthora megakarya]